MRSFFLLLWLAVGVFGQCRVPQYQGGGVLMDSGTEVIMNISIALPDFAPARLVCLASNLEEQYRGRNSIIVSFFSSPDAASHSMGFLLDQEDTKAELDAFAKMHARYVFSADRHENYLETIPMHEPYSRKETKAYSTRIDLPLAAAPRCRLEISDRCLIAVENAFYPNDALKGKVSGAVTLAGTITRDGKVSHARVVKTESIGSGRKDHLANAVLQNLSTWRLEPGAREDPIQITYSFAIDNSLPFKGQTEVQWYLPNKVEVRGNPPQ
ncbi:MAG TPA: energy transducer TonB [Bryobacteraceae bacterium]|nr:energy transducer TonB [Bryobacteraceae bacterium]